MKSREGKVERVMNLVHLHFSPLRIDASLFREAHGGGAILRAPLLLNPSAVESDRGILVFPRGCVSSQVVFPRCRSTDFRLWVGIVPNLTKSSHTKTLDHLRLSARQPMPGLCASDSIAGRHDGDSQLADGGRGREELRRGYRDQQQLAGFRASGVHVRPL